MLLLKHESQNAQKDRTLKMKTFHPNEQENFLFIQGENPLFQHIFPLMTQGNESSILTTSFSEEQNAREHVLISPYNFL